MCDEANKPKPEKHKPSIHPSVDGPYCGFHTMQEWENARELSKQSFKKRNKQDALNRRNFYENPASYEEIAKEIIRFLWDKQIPYMKRDIEDKSGRAIYQNYKEEGGPGTIEPERGAQPVVIYQCLQQKFPGIGDGNIKYVLRQMEEDGLLEVIYDEDLWTIDDSRESKMVYILTPMAMTEYFDPKSTTQKNGNMRTPKKKRKGRKPDTDIDADRKIADAWGTGCYRRYADLASEKGLSKDEVKLAIDRHRHRRKKG